MSLYLVVFVISLVSQIGDMFHLIMLKEKSKIKDTGKIIAWAWRNTR